MARFRERPELDACVTFVQEFHSPELSPGKAPVDGEPVPGYRSVTLLARRAVFDSVGRFDPALRHGNDTDWFLRAADQRAVIELMPDVLRRREAGR
jgi:hypothetical protein